MFWAILICFFVVVAVLVRARKRALRGHRSKWHWGLYFRITGSWLLRWIIFPLLWLSLLGTAIIIICLVISHICYITGASYPSLVTSFTDVFLSELGWNIEQLTEVQYAAIVSDMIVILAFLLTIVPVVQFVYFKVQYIRKFRREQGIETFKVRIKGKDDLDTMLRHYEGAEHLTIFCGAFDWLRENANMKHLITNLANDDKLKLVSYKSEEQVRSAFASNNGQIFFRLLLDKGCFRFNSGLPDVKCSLIKRVGAETKFLFRQSSEQNPFNACVLSSTDQSRELLHILSKLTEADMWGSPQG